ncbi:MAG: C10 family peptidase [Planctomycetes bacterium]|nr:C10 family peptidase [Planctomycetota bacterium]
MGRFGGRESLVVLSVVGLLLGGSALFAAPVDPARVRQVTEGFLQAKAASRPSSPLTILSSPSPSNSLRPIVADDGTVLAYVMDLEPSGFVALAADTDLAPVIAYSFRSPFPADGDKANPLYRMVREDLRLRIKALAEHPELKSPETARQWTLYAEGGKAAPAVGANNHSPRLLQPVQQWPPEGSTATGGLVATAWDQEPPYNQFCPLDTVDGGRSYVGCAATVMAQILNFHRQCNVALGPSDAYTMSNGMKMDADSTLYDFPSFNTLNDYVAAIRAKYQEGIDLNDVDMAALNFACGVAMHMDYSSDGSGASPYAAQDAMVRKFGFAGADMFGGLSAESFLVLQENIINGLPAMIGLRPTDGYGGHAVVCDGYNTDGEYHLNFGWGSLYPQKITDVWYRLPTGFYPLELVITESVLNLRPEELAIQTNPASLNFYGTPGQDSDPQVLRIENNADRATVQSITSPEGFLIAKPDDFSNQLGSFTLSRPKQYASVRVKFHPEREGGYYGTLAIRYDDGKVRYVILRGWSFASATQVAAGAVSGTWTQDQSPYFVGGDLQVPANDKLTIEPGVKVFFLGPYGLTVGKNATLTAQGNAAQPIELTAWNRETGWAGLRFVDSGNDDVLRYCWLSWAKKATGLIPTESSGETGVDEPDSHGGAIYCSHSDPTLESCRLTNNVGDGGGAIYCVDSSPILSNTLIANNTSLGGVPRCGGFCISQSGLAKLRNCTLVNNSPGGVFTASWDGLTLTNSIVWGNQMYQIQTEESVPQVTFCDVQGGYPGAGNRSADPCFFSPSAGPGIEYDGAAANWALQTRSPCINAGTEVQDLPALDMAGAARIASGVLDLGAYENQSELPLLTITPSGTADAGFVQVDANETILLDFTNTGKQDCTIQSVSVSEGDQVFSLPTAVENRVLAPGASLSVQVAFHPTREVVYRGKLEVRSTAANAGQIQIALKGMGVLGTVVPGGSVSGTWKKASSPYIVTGDITVPRNKTLTVEPGVTVKFAGHFGLTVGYKAKLLAVGTGEDRIVFTAGDKTQGWFGLRLINSGSDDKLQFCTLEYARKPRTGGGGVTGLFGGAILCYGSYDDDPGFPVPGSPTVDSCLLTHNYARTGGAIACLECEAVVTNNTILENAAEYDGGGIALYNTQGTIANNVIARNYAQGGGGIMNVMSSPSILNNTIVANRPSALELDSALVDFFGAVMPASILNNIVWKNEISLSDTVEPNDFEIRYNDIQGGWAGAGNIDKDPLFADLDANDFHLKSQAGRWDPAAKTWVADTVTSPCIDAGDPTADLADEPEPNGNRINLGADGGTAQASKSPG